MALHAAACPRAILFKLKDAFEKCFEDISKTLVTEEGKTLDESRGEVRRMIENVEHATGVTTLMTGYSLEDIAQGIDCTAEIVRSARRLEERDQKFFRDASAKVPLPEVARLFRRMAAKKKKNLSRLGVFLNG